MLENLNTKLVLFDLDGTLIDTAPDFLSSLNNVLTRYNKRNVSASGIRTYISEGSSKLIKYAFDIDERDKDFKKYKHEFLLEYKSKVKQDTNVSKIIKSFRFFNLLQHERQKVKQIWIDKLFQNAVCSDSKRSLQETQRLSGSN